MRNAISKGNPEGRVYLGLSMWTLACAQFYYKLGHAKGYVDASSSLIVTLGGIQIPGSLIDIVFQVPFLLFLIVVALQLNRKFFGAELNVRRLDTIASVVIPISAILWALSFAL